MKTFRKSQWSIPPWPLRASIIQRFLLASTVMIWFDNPCANNAMCAQLTNKMCPWQGTGVFLQHRVFDCMVAMTSCYWRHRLHDSPYVLLPYSSVLACMPLINKDEGQSSKAHGTSSSLEIHNVRKPRNQVLSHRHEYFYFHEQIQAWLFRHWHVYFMHAQAHQASSQTRS